MGKKIRSHLQLMFISIFPFVVATLSMTLYITGCAKKENNPRSVKIQDVPPAYFNKHMPAGWWTDEDTIAAGKAIYEGKKHMDVRCAACHGSDGMPILAGTRDLRNTSVVNQWSDSYWFWRVSEGVPDTAMTGWKENLTEEEIWQVIAYAHIFSHGGKAEEHKH